MIIPKLNSSKSRTDKLWEETCFELFLGVGREQAKDLRYREFNLSPSGAWNSFTLQGYRYAAQAESDIESLPLEVKKTDDALTLKADIDISSIAAASDPIRLGISAVILVKNAAQETQETFWAIEHPAAEPDFHHPNSFALFL